MFQILGGDLEEMKFMFTMWEESSGDKAEAFSNTATLSLDACSLPI
jgi:hypothetical protein